MKNRFSHVSASPILPAYNAQKNLGYQTQYRVHEFQHGHQDIESGNFKYTTLSLLRIYFSSGEKIGGPLEVRSKWGYNDLKPRIYYGQAETESILASCTVLHVPSWYYE